MGKGQGMAIRAVWVFEIIPDSEDTVLFGGP